MAFKVKKYLSGLSLTKRFILASFVIIILGMLGISWWVNQQIANGVIHRTSATTALFVESFISSHLQELSGGGYLSDEHRGMLDHLLSDSSLGRQIVAFKVWDTSGVVQYGTDESSVGKNYPVEGGLARALNGEVASRISNLELAENISERDLGKHLIETYIPVRRSGTDRIIAVVEFYQKADDLQNEIRDAQLRSLLVVAGAMMLVFLSLSGFVKNTSDTIDQQKVELSHQVDQLTDLLQQNRLLHERSRRASASITTIHERLLRRIGSDLHDGPAQDLSLALLKLDSLQDEVDGRTVEPTKNQQRNNQVKSIQNALQSALKELRAISSGLGLPELADLSLPDTINQVVRTHERRTYTNVNLVLEYLPEQCPISVKITLYRVIQETLNNSYHHAQGNGQSVMVKAYGDQVYLEVSDQGPGFDFKQIPDWENHLGIAGMRERVESIGGRFSITSDQHQGTIVCALLNLNPEEVNRE